MKFDEFRQTVNQSFGSLLDSMSEGWDRLRQSAAGAMTRFRPGEDTNLPAREQIDDTFYMPQYGWSMLGGDVFEDEQRLVVRIEAPGLEKEDFDIQVRDDALVIRGEKRFSHESTDGRWRILQCAYGSFHRSVPLSVPVRGEEASASYRNGVLRIELPKTAPMAPKMVNIRVS